MMNDQDRELIAELAHGGLSPHDADAALARVEADEELSLEYEAQISVLAYLHSAETPMLTKTEQSTLRSNLTEQLGLSPAPAVVAPAKRTARWMQPVFGLVTAAGVIAAVVILPGLLSGQNSSDSADVALAPAITQSAEGSASTTEAADAAAPGDLRDDGEPEMLLFASDSVDVDELLAQVQGATTQDEASSKLLDSLMPSSSESAASDSTANCSSDIADQLDPDVTAIIPLGAIDTDTGNIVHFGISYGSGIEDVVSVDSATCAIIDSSTR